MKETIQFNGKEYKYKGWRIPEDYKLPAVFRDGQEILDAEVLFEAEDGELKGIHPLSNLLKEK